MNLHQFISCFQNVSIHGGRMKSCISILHIFISLISLLKFFLRKLEQHNLNYIKTMTLQVLPLLFLSTTLFVSIPWNYGKILNMKSFQLCTYLFTLFAVLFFSLLCILWTLKIVFVTLKMFWRLLSCGMWYHVVRHKYEFCDF